MLEAAAGFATFRTKTGCRHESNAMCGTRARKGALPQSTLQLGRIRGQQMPVRPELRNRALRLAVKEALATVAAVEATALAFVNRGQDLTGAEITRTEFRRRFTEEAELLRKQLRGILDQAILQK